MVALPLKLEWALRWSYLFESPYTISRKFEGDHLYGETPLATVAHLARTFGFGKTVLDLGCGTGRVALYLNSIGHTVVGIDHVPQFIFKGERIINYFQLHNITLQRRDARQVEFEGFDTIYIAGTCFPDDLLSELTLKMAKTQARVITVSEPLDHPYMVVGETRGKFPWGETTIYCNEPIS